MEIEYRRHLAFGRGMPARTAVEYDNGGAAKTHEAKTTLTEGKAYSPLPRGWPIPALLGSDVFDTSRYLQTES